MAARYDVAILGTGAGGGTLAYALAPTGKNILLLERGDYVPREKDNWETRAVNLEGKYNTKEVWRDRDGKELHPHTNYYVGGNTKFYGAALFRLRREDFGEVKHWGGVSPARPVADEALEPYYARAEQLDHGHGERGVDPTDPPAQSPSPHPPVSHEPRIQQLADDWARLGRRPFHVPLGVMLDETNPRKSRCIRCATCDGHPCLVYAKSDAQVVCVDPALEHPNVTLVTNAHVTRLETSASGREVTHIVVERQGATETYAADVVVVACGAINSAALLLRSATDRHPRGLANGSDVVARNHIGHVNSVLMALSKRPNPTVFQKTLALNDFYFGSAEWEYPMGHISFVGKLDARAHGAALARLLAHLGGPARSGQPRDARPGGQHRARVPAQQRGEPPASRRRAQAPDEAADEVPRPRARVPRGPLRAQPLPRPAHSAGRCRAPERHDPVWTGPEDVRAGRELQGPRPRQPLRRGRELLPVERGGESCAHDRGQRASRWRPPEGTAALMLDWGREVAGDLDVAERREWLSTNGIGGFASGTVAGSLTRRYHGLLVAALQPPPGRTLLVAKVEETAEYDGLALALGTNRWAGGAVDPRGYREIEGFRLGGTTPVWTYALADALLEKRVWMEPGANTTYVRYHVLRARGSVSLHLKALVNYRDYHATTRGDGWRMDVAPVN